MSKKRYITIQILPDDTSDAWTIKLRYRFFEFLFYAVIIALFATALAAVKITEINGKVLTANHLASINQKLLDKQEKMDLLERELTLIAEQERKIRSIVQTFIAEGSDSAKDSDAGSRFSQADLDKFVADVRASGAFAGVHLVAGTRHADLAPLLAHHRDRPVEARP